MNLLRSVLGWSCRMSCGHSGTQGAHTFHPSVCVCGRPRSHNFLSLSLPMHGQVIKNSPGVLLTRASQLGLQSFRLTGLGSNYRSSLEMHYKLRAWRLLAVPISISSLSATASFSKRGLVHISASSRGGTTIDGRFLMSKIVYRSEWNSTDEARINLSHYHRIRSRYIILSSWHARPILPWWNSVSSILLSFCRSRVKSVSVWS